MSAGSHPEQEKKKLLYIGNRWVNSIYTGYGVTKQKILLQIIETLQTDIRKVMNGKRVAIGVAADQELCMDLDMSKIIHYNNYAQVRKAVEQMSRNPIKIYNDPDFKKPIYFSQPLLSGFEPGNEKKIIKLALKKNIVELLLFVDYKPDKKKGNWRAEQFTSFDAKCLSRLTCKYYQPIYLMMCSYLTKGGFTIDIDPLRERLQVEEKYKGFDNFNRYVLKHVQKEMQLSADISFNFSVIKTGKVVKQIVFKIFSNTKQDENHSWLKIYRALHQELPHFMRFTELQFSEFNYLLTSKYDLDEVYNKLQHIHKALVRKKEKEGKLHSPFHYTLKAIQEQFPPG